MRTFNPILIAVALLMPSISVLAGQWKVSPSFDCAIDKLSRVEAMICGDAELSAKDYRLGQIYKLAMTKSKDKDGLKKIQVDWLTKVRSRCSSSKCLYDVYEAQEIYLGEIAISDGRFDLEDDRTKYVRRHVKTNDSESLKKRLNDEFKAANKLNSIVISCDSVWENHAGRINDGWGGFCWAEIDGQLGEYASCGNQVTSDMTLVKVRNEYLMVRHLETKCYGG